MNADLKKTAVIKGWFELFRLPNLFTVPGDILAGASLAHIADKEIRYILPVMCISLLLYISGLALNDYFDREADSGERPERPIASGRISAKKVLILSIFFMGIAIFISSLMKSLIFFITLGLVSLIVIYNGGAKQIPILGAVTMGLCRGINLLLGASICSMPFSAIVFTGAGIETMYIAAVSTIAYNETKALQFPLLKLSLPLFSLMGIFVFFMLTNVSVLAIFMILLAVSSIFFTLWKTAGDKKSAPERVGGLIRNLILIQCVYIVFAIDKNHQQFIFHNAAIVFLLVCYLISGRAAKMFYGS